MSDNLLDIKFKFPKWKQTIENNRDRIMLFLAAQMQTNRAMLFDQEGAYNGRKKWAPLKFRKGQILSKTGTLRKSIGPVADKTPKYNTGSIVTIGNDEVTIGTNLAYAKVQNEGAKIVAIKAQALKIPTGDGKFIFRKSAVVPARVFNDLNEEDKTEFSIALKNFITELLNAAS